MKRQEFRDILKKNIGNGDAADFVFNIAAYGTDIEDGVITPDSAYEAFIDDLVNRLDFLTEDPIIDDDEES